MEDLLDKIEQIQAMRLQDNDIIVLSIDRSSYTDSEAHDLFNNFNKMLKNYGCNNKVLIKPKDIDIDILRKEDILNG